MPCSSAASAASKDKAGCCHSKHVTRNLRFIERSPEEEGGCIIVFDVKQLAVFHCVQAITPLAAVILLMRGQYRLSVLRFGFGVLYFLLFAPVCKRRQDAYLC